MIHHYFVTCFVEGSLGMCKVSVCMSSQQEVNSCGLRDEVGVIPLTLGPAQMTQADDKLTMLLLE